MVRGPLMVAVMLGLRRTAQDGAARVAPVVHRIGKRRDVVIRVHTVLYKAGADRVHCSVAIPLNDQPFASSFNAESRRQRLGSVMT